MHALQTITYGDGASTSMRRPRSPLVDRVDRYRRPQQDDFAAVKHGLDTIRSRHYGSGNRMPNANSADQTRRRRSLTGGPGDRFLTGLDLWIEREISRELREQSPIYDGMIQSWAAEIMQTGWRTKPATGDEDLNKQVAEALFGWDGDGGWANDCDSRGMHHLWDLLRLAEETELTDGDHGLWLDPDDRGGLGSVAIIEGDRILTPYGADGQLLDGYTVQNGIVCDERGKPVGAWIADIAPMAACASVDLGHWYPMFDPAHPERGGLVFSVRPKRYTSTRRQPWLSSAVRTLDEIDDAFTAMRILLRNAACRATWTKIEKWDDYKDWLTLVMEAPDAAPAPAASPEHSPNPGDHVHLNPGEAGGIWETNAPGENFGPFSELQLQMAGLPLGMCLEEAVRIFQRNFSASRLAVEGTRRSRYEPRQKQIKRRKLSPILRFAVARMQVVGALPSDERCHRTRVGFCGWPYIEPLKDAKADETRVAAKLRSRRTSATEIGDDWDQELEFIREEEQALGTTATAATAPITGFEGNNSE